MAADILLAAINAKWIHPSLALRLLKANLGHLKERCEIMEFALRQPLSEKVDPILAVRPRILGLSVSIWNHTATLELLKELRRAWEGSRYFIILGGPEVSYLPAQAEIFRYADYCIRGEGEIAFAALCSAILCDGNAHIAGCGLHEINVNEINVAEVKSGYHLYTNEDLRKKLTYVEASRGCAFGCEFCQSANSGKVREYPLPAFFAEMDDLIARGAKTFKFLDRSFNLNIERARQIMEYFLGKIDERAASSGAAPLVVHFEMVPFRFPPELLETLARFPAGTLRLEIGIQTLNAAVCARIGRPPEQEQALRLLREKTNAIIHADLIAGLPGEDMASFARGFDLLWAAMRLPQALWQSGKPAAEIQLGILKLLPGTAIARHTEAFGMRYSPSPPYEVIETAAIPAHDFDRIKNFARFWELLVNRGLFDPGPPPVFGRFINLSDSLAARFGRNWGIAKNQLLEAVHEQKNFFNFTGC